MATNIPNPYGLTYNEAAYFASYKVTFPKTPDFNKDIGLVGAELYQVMEEHDRLILHFKGKPSNRDTTVSYGDPVIFEYKSGKTSYMFYGTVYQIDPKNTQQANNLDIICLSASATELKNTDQQIYTNVTADQVVSKIAAKNSMKAITQRHPRVRKSIVQAGQSYWQLLRRLAKQTGFALRAENTNIIFMSKDKIFQTKKKYAPYFNYVAGTVTGTVTKPERLFGTIIDFYPRVSDNSAELGTRVDRVITGVNQKSGDIIETTHSAKDYDVESKGVVVPGEDYFE